MRLCARSGGAGLPHLGKESPLWVAVAAGRPDTVAALAQTIANVAVLLPQNAPRAARRDSAES